MAKFRVTILCVAEAEVEANNPGAAWARLREKLDNREQDVSIR